MTRTARITTLALWGFLATLNIVRAGGVGLEAQWLWASRYPRANERVTLSRDIELSTPIRQAVMLGLADDAAVVRIDGESVAEVAGTRKFTRVVLERELAKGHHRIEIEARNVSGAAGVWLQIDMTAADGRSQRVVTDTDWEVRALEGRQEAQPPSGKRAFDEIPPVSLGLLGVSPWWRPVGELDDYDQWKRAIGTGKADEAARIQVIPGFEVELLRSSQPGEGSWVSVIFDSKGRLIIGREGAGILRMSLPDSLVRSPLPPGSSSVRSPLPAGERVRERGRQSLPANDSSSTPNIQVELINDQLQECRGLLWAFDSLYANANNSKGLYRLRDTDGDDKFDEVNLLKATGGGVGHGRNALALGPDNKIYVIHGNNVLVSETDRRIDESSPLRFMDEDRLRPAFWDRFMFDADVRVPAGYVARTDADGKTWEVVAGGFRNPYGLDFNTDGELFTFDADNEGDQGTPWYRPTRFNHIVSGGDYGFRQGSANRPGHYAEHLPSNLDMGLASPTGVKSGHRSNFPSPYREAIFVCDWSYGRIHAIHLQEHGASYRCNAELFLEGQPLNVTDLTFGPDGAMYFVTGGRGTQSGLYRVSATQPTSGKWLQVRSPASSNDTHAERLQRRSLERWHRVVDPNAFRHIWATVSDDQWIRHAARIALEHQPLEGWVEKVQQERIWAGHARLRIDPLFALARVAGTDSSLDAKQRLALSKAIVEELNELRWNRLTPEQQLDAFRIYAVAFSRLGHPEPEVANSVRAALAQRYPHELEFPNQRLCELLAYLEWPPLVEKTIPRLEAAVEQEDKLAYLTILRDVKVGWNMELRRRYFVALQEADTFDGGNLLPIAVNGIREDALATLSTDERHELGAVLEPAAQQDNTSATATAQRPIVREWKLEDLDEALKSTNSQRDLSRGQRLFREVLCVQCHRFGGEGRTLGPDITFVANRFGPRDLLEHLLVPSKVIDGKYRQTIVETKSGQVLVGRLIGGDDKNLLVATDPLRPTKVTKLPLDNIETRKASPVSPMPVGLLNSLTQDEILDLLEYLRVGNAPRQESAAKPSSK